MSNPTDQQLNNGPHIVAIGGGTGMPVLLRGLRHYTRNITAIVTVADDGGSSGRLRRELGVLPPGDFRNNIAALSRDEALMTQLLQYRFGGNGSGNGRSGLQGHAFGNLLIAALTGITGSFDEALLATQKVLAIRGQVMPATLEHVTLVADVLVKNDQTSVVKRIKGESAISKARGRIQALMLEPAHIRAYPPAVRAIFQADLVVYGPGSLFTSILPNLLLPDLQGALSHSRAKKVYVCNIAVQPGETDDFTAKDHIAALLQYIPENCLDNALVNSNVSISREKGGGNTLFVSPVAHPDIPVHLADLVDEERPWRHDSDKLASAIISLLNR